jgi:CDP-glycerol glycerophosphotransferase (TagB/SpsB family)/glycosyltransferase involved in cell wall biosynthesis
VADYVDATIQNLLGQTLKDVELILVDDGSTDESYQLALKYANEHANVVVFHQENKGPGAARNAGLRLAKGEYITFVDADDLLDPAALEVMYNAAVEHDADMVTGGMVRFNSEKQWSIKQFVDHGVMEPGLKHITTHPGLLYSMGPCGKLYKRELIEGVFFPEHYRVGEDQPFVLHAYLNAKRIYTVDMIVYYYRFREGDNQSLTQRALANPSGVMRDMYEMVSLTDKLLEDHPALHVYYLNRVMVADILPRVRAALWSKDGEVQQIVLESLYNWLLTRDEKERKKVAGHHTHLLISLFLCRKAIQAEAREAYRRLIVQTLRTMGIPAYAVLLRKVCKECAKRVPASTKKYVSKGKSAVIRRVVYPISKRLPLQTKKVVFATNRSSQLDGNLQVLHDYVKQHKRDWNVVVLPKEQRNFWRRCLVHYHLATAKVVFLDDYYRQLYNLTPRKGTEVVQTWHASGAFKKFGISAVGTRDSNPLDFELAAHRAYTKVIVSSQNVAKHYAEAFNKREDQILALGVPKTDVFFHEETKEQIRRSYLEQYPMLQGKKLLLYAPTFRGKPKERKRFKLMLDLNKMKEALGREYALILKMHPAVQSSTLITDELSDFVLDLSKCTDINDLLILADCLITDYSSIVFEYSLLKRPMVFFAYDLEDYLAERGFYVDYRDFVPGPIVRTTEEIIDAIQSDNWPYDKIEQFSRYYFDHHDGRSTQRIVDMFLK